MNSLFLITSGTVFIFYSLYVLFEIYKIYNKKQYGLSWLITTLVLSLFLSIYSFYTNSYLNRISISNSIMQALFAYIYAGLSVIIVLRFSMHVVIKVKTTEKEVLEEKKMFEKENIELQRDSYKISKDLAVKVSELEQARTAMINILEDVTMQKDELVKSKIAMEKLNFELAKTNKELLELDKQKDQFTSITAHELKTPLTSIHGFVQLLQDPKILSDKEKRTRYTKIILQDTERLSRLITDILDISRMDLGTLKFYFEELYLAEFMKNVHKEMSQIVKSKHIDFAYNIKINTPSVIVTDKNRLAQVLTNLINNAVHYTHEGGKISFGVEKTASHLVFHVKDTGEGIHKAQQNKIFERFYQVDSWLTRKIAGSGLGLAICKGLVTGLGGKIWVKSKLKKGSTFYFSTPVKAKEHEFEKEKYVKIFETMKHKKPLHIEKMLEEKKPEEKEHIKKEKPKTIEKKVEDFFK